MATLTQHGYLVLADISGYTSYFAGNELEHAHEILTALLETIVAKFKTLLTISKLEGDAVFGYVPEAKLPRGETLLEMLESTYVAFRDHVEAAHRRTTCECNACRNIPSLDLKFMTHHGDFIVQHISGIKELVGSDVNLVHRLMKNHIAEATGWHAYALFTDKSLDHMGLRPAEMHEQAEAYEHLGEVKTFSLNMRQRYKELKDANPVLLKPEEADVVVTHDFPVPPPIVWNWTNDPGKRVLWSSLTEVKVFRRKDGRTGAGAKVHCIHDKKLVNAETVLDWRPFEYWTHQSTSGPMLLTFYLESIRDGQGTRLSMRIKGQMPIPDFIRRPMLNFMMKFFKMSQAYDKLEAMMVNEQKELAALEQMPESESKTQE